MLWLPLTILMVTASASVQGAPVPDAHVDYWVRTLKTSPLKLIRKNAARNLGKLGDQTALAALSEALQDKEGVVRVEAAKSLGNLGNEQAFSALGVAQDDPDREVRKAASDAIEKIKATIERQKQKEAKDLKESSPSGY